MTASKYTSDVLDEAQDDNEVTPIKYDITSYGADFDVEGLINRIKRGDVFIPKFQRDYVWNQVEASRFIESLLLGLPVPGIFLAKEKNSNKLLVIDGQQRLLSLQYFFDGIFKPESNTITRRVFSLQKVQPQFRERTFEQLDRI